MFIAGTVRINSLISAQSRNLKQNHTDWKLNISFQWTANKIVDCLISYIVVIYVVCPEELSVLYREKLHPTLSKSLLLTDRMLYSTNSSYAITMDERQKVYACEESSAKDFLVIEEILMSRLAHYRPSFVNKLVYHFNLYPKKTKYNTLVGLTKRVVKLW